MKMITVSEFRSKLSHYMDEMRIGERIQIRDMVICCEEVVLDTGSRVEDLEQRLFKVEEFISDNRH